MIQIFLRKATGTNSEQQQKKKKRSIFQVYVIILIHKKKISATKQEIFHLLNKKCLSFSK